MSVLIAKQKNYPTTYFGLDPENPNEEISLSDKNDSIKRDVLSKESCNEFSRFIKNAWEQKDNEPKPGDLVYVKFKPSGTVINPIIDYVVPVTVSRLRYEKIFNDFIPSQLLACETSEKLCPACRLFGWVQQGTGNRKGEQTNQRAAIAGRINFTNAELKPGVVIATEKITLNALSQPKPTTSYFYLWPKKGNNLNDIFKRGYNTDAWIRGRKFYRHHNKKLNIKCMKIKSRMSRVVH